MKKKKICIVIANRANYSSIKSVIEAIGKHPRLEHQLIVGSSAVLDRFGSVVNLIKKDGFIPDAVFHMIVEGETPATMAKSAGLGLLELSTLFLNLKPDIVITVGDRFEIITVAVAAILMNITLAHTMGGEISGTIDESIRHAVTKLAHIHFPANQESADRIIKMGERPENVHVVGCPRIDLVKSVLKRKNKLNRNIFKEFKGVGETFSFSKPFLLVVQHPVTTEYGQGRKQIEETLFALDTLKMPTIMLWPNVDAGSEDIAKGIRTFRERNNANYLHLFKNLPPEVYIRLMDTCKCVIGNTSSAIREGAFIGTPAVNIGSRQNGRQRGKNVIDVDCDRKQIVNAIKKQIKHGKYNSEHIYGNGNAGERIADILSKCNINIQKQNFY
ncbi:MAG: UDP-N-acetylglucosamine 2-epimerase [Phycisphaerae bacterium]|jgi:UDP-N-acetylglucosamine 2-epimerase